MKFNEVAQVFGEIERTSKRLEITKLLANILKRATPKEAHIISTISLGQLYPPYVGTQFNMAQKSVEKSVAQLMHMSEAEIAKQAKKLGDLGLLVEQGRWRPREELTVTQVYNRLCDIESIGGTGSQEEKVEQLKNLLHDLSVEEAKYIVRIVIGKLRLGFSDMTIVDALSWMEVGDKSVRRVIEDAYNVRADIGLIAQELKEGGLVRLEKMGVEVGIPIRPASAERLPTAQAIIAKVGRCVAQPKLDGFRLQIHLDKTKRKPEIHFFSRNLIDMSEMFPDVAQAIEQLPVETLICEGEAIVYDPNTDSFLPFQTTVKRKRKHGIEQAAQELPLRVFLFDLLYINGTDYMNKTHEQRRKKLVALGHKIKGDEVQIIEEKEIHIAKQLEKYFLQNIQAGLEGVVVKKEDAIYQPGKRNFNWIKFKRQEEGHLEDTIDCVILGYYAGRGKRAGFGIGAFLVGVYNPKKDTFETIAKIGTGLKDAEWKELKKRCDAIKIERRPSQVECDKSLYPDVWVYPELVCLVRADEITLSPVHAAGKTADKLGYALRFPRFMGYREDKGPTEATTVHEIKRLYEDQF